MTKATQFLIDAEYARLQVPAKTYFKDEHVNFFGNVKFVTTPFKKLVAEAEKALKNATKPMTVEFDGKVEKYSVGLQQTVGNLFTGLESGDIFDQSTIEKELEDLYKKLKNNKETGKPYKKVIVTFNGIWTDRDRAILLKDSVLSWGEEVPKLAVWNGSHRLVAGNKVLKDAFVGVPPIGDIIQILNNELGIIDFTAFQAKQTLRIVIKAFEKLAVADWELEIVAHSQGTMIFYRASQEFAPDIKARMNFYGNGGELIISQKEGYKTARNFLRDNDGVPIIGNLLSPIRRASNLAPNRWKDFQNVVLLGKAVKGPEGKVDAHNWQKNYQKIYSEKGGLVLPVDAVLVKWPIRTPLLPPLLPAVVGFAPQRFAAAISRDNLKSELSELLFGPYLFDVPVWVRKID